MIIPHVIPKGKMFFFVGQEWARYRNAETQTGSPQSPDAAGKFQRVCSGQTSTTANRRRSTIPLLVHRSGLKKPRAFPGQYRSRLAAEPERHGHLETLSGAHARLFERQPELDRAASQPENQRKETINSDMLPSDNRPHQFPPHRSSLLEKDPFDQGTNLTPKEFNRPNQAGSLACDHTFSPTLLNEARVTVSFDDVYIPVITSSAGFQPLGFRDRLSLHFPRKAKISRARCHRSTFQHVPFLPRVPTIALHRPDLHGFRQLDEDPGNHSFKAGFYFERSGENDGDQINVSSVPGGSNNQNGTFTFTEAGDGLGATSSVGVANLALGLADSYTEIGTRAYTIFRGFLYEWFAQDSWKVNQKLTVNYGMRQTIKHPVQSAMGQPGFLRSRAL